MKAGRSCAGVLICFVGIDGAGKSTLAKALVARTEEHGIRWKHVWGGFNASFTIFRPMIGAMKRSVFRGNRHMHESRTKGRVLRSSLLSTVYQYLAVLDYLLQTLVRIRLPLALGRNVVCDRYIYDLITSIGVLLDYPPDRTLTLLDRCLALVPQPDLTFLVDLPEALAYQRKDDIVALEFLSVRRAIYLQMAKRYRMITLDGSSDPAGLAKLATRKVLQHMVGEC